LQLPEDGKTSVLQSEDGRTTKSDSEKPTVPTPKGTPTPEPTKISATPEPLLVDTDRPPSGVKEEPEKPQPGEGGEKVDEKKESSKMHVICHDDNIRTKSLDNLPADQVRHKNLTGGGEEFYILRGVG
jgi:hypothetical protein